MGQMAGQGTLRPCQKRGDLDLPSTETRVYIMICIFYTFLAVAVDCFAYLSQQKTC
jgi:hypothetical protein